MRQALVMTLVLVVFGWIWFYPRLEPMENMDVAATLLDPIKIEIEGSVVFPGTYLFFKPVTASEILEMAGGFLDDADQHTVNMQTLYTHDTQIFIASNLEEETETGILLNVNQASFKELLDIPGMTEIRAASLIIYREQYGDFKHLDELINVKNIGEVTLEKIKPYLTVG